MDKKSSMMPSEFSGEGSRRALLMAAGLGALATVTGVPQPAHAEGDSSSAQQRAAISVVNDLIAALVRRDVDKMASYLSDDVVFKATLLNKELNGIESFKRDFSGFLNSPIGRAISVDKRLGHVYAIDVSGGTALLVQRTEHTSMNGKTFTSEVAAAFFLVDGKIRAWFDMVIPPGAPPAGGQAPPGN